jgi:hypothetical protein
VTRLLAGKAAIERSWLTGTGTPSTEAAPQEELLPGDTKLLDRFLDSFSRK